MKIKIDECLPQECSALLHQKGHNTETVYQEGLQGAPEQKKERSECYPIFSGCCRSIILMNGRDIL